MTVVENADLPQDEPTADRSNVRSLAAQRVKNDEKERARLFGEIIKLCAHLQK